MALALFSNRMGCGIRYVWHGYTGELLAAGEEIKALLENGRLVGPKIMNPEK